MVKGKVLYAAKGTITYVILPAQSISQELRSGRSASRGQSIDPVN